MKELVLTQGMIAYVDDEDYKKVAQYKWTVSQTHKLFYAVRADPIQGTTYLHRFILEPALEMSIDHIDHNGLNCIRSNMRIVSHQANMINRRTVNETGYRGIFQDKRRGCYGAQIKDMQGNRHYLGTFTLPEDAARAYDEAAKLYHGEFAVLNFS
jgi:hypothetical protein